MPSGLEEGEITPTVVRNYPSEGGQSPQGNGGQDGGARFEGWTRAATLQSSEWARAQNWIACQTVEIDSNYE
jgi:hypothetical protein